MCKVIVDCRFVALHTTNTVTRGVQFTTEGFVSRNLWRGGGVPVAVFWFMYRPGCVLFRKCPARVKEVLR